MADAISRRGLLAGGAALMAAGTSAAEPTAFDFRFTAIEGGPLDLVAFRGRPLLVANTASLCGYTPQFAGLERLHERFTARGLLVLGVPSNDFNQELGTVGEIRQFCEGNYDVRFPMTTPEHVVGAQAHPLFAWLAVHAGGPPQWNFHKYLVARDGRTARAFPTGTEPDAPAMLRAIESALG